MTYTVWKRSYRNAAAPVAMTVNRKPSWNVDSYHSDPVKAAARAAALPDAAVFADKARPVDA